MDFLTGKSTQMFSVELNFGEYWHTNSPSISFVLSCWAAEQTATTYMRAEELVNLSNICERQLFVKCNVATFSKAT